MENNNLFMGTQVEFFNPISYKPKVEKFILAECNEPGYTFQLISISGYSAGSISAYIRIDPICETENNLAVTTFHLVKELKRNFGDIDESSLKIVS